MKVIDLLNKMANGEEVPEKIKVGNIIYIYESWEHFYYTDNEEREDLLVRGKDYSTIDFLNWNVELIEDEIDIDSIEAIKTEAIGDLANETKTIVNKILQWAKQTDKEIKIIKEK